MNEPDESVWIYAGNCPVCQCGLRRIRVSESPDGEQRGYVLCDECEAIWLTPDASSNYHFPHAEKPECPVSAGPLYGPQSRWATLDDVEKLGWIDRVTIDAGVDPSDRAGTSTSIVAPEDVAGDLDAPPSLRLQATRASMVDSAGDLPKQSHSPSADSSYGADEPRPGC